MLALAAFVADGGLGLERTTYVEIGLMLLGALLCAAALLVPRARAQRAVRRAARCSAFALLAAFTALSIVWSLAPSDSWIEAEPHARLPVRVRRHDGARRGSPRATGTRCCSGIALACVVVCGWALLTKIFPGALAEDETYARLRAPFDYWNAGGLDGGARHPAAAVAGRAPLGPAGGQRARLAGHRAARGRADAVVLARLAARAAVGLAFWFAVVPLRLRGAIVLLGASAGAAPIVALGVHA